MDKENPTPQYLKPYQEAVEEHGGNFEATLWRSKKGQELRFQAFTQEIDFSGTTILDIGCGIGAFAEHLLQADMQYDTYIGIDAMEEMITTANARTLARATFQVDDVLQNTSLISDFDWAIFSGTLNAMNEDVAEELIKTTFQACKIGVAFNFLSDTSGRDPETEDLHPATRFNTISWLKTAFSLSPVVSFTQTYLHGHDGTIIIRKQEVPQ